MNRGYRVPPRSQAIIREAALSFRNALGLPATEPWFPVVDVYDWRLPKVWEQFHYVLVEPHEMDEHAIAFPGEARIVVRADIYERAGYDEGRDRFTMCHELGHVMLEHSPILARSGSTPTWPVYEDSEWQANTYAAELLMPVAVVLKCRTPDELARVCGVSIDAAITRRRLMKR